MVSLDALSPSIDHAFSWPCPDAMLRVNCSGGAPAQAEMIHRRIRSMADVLSVPVIASVEDVATSAGYWVALAADHILVQESSQIGSIGTVSYQFGFDKLLARLGVERRVLASGPDKVDSDPFLPQSDRARERALSIQNDILDAFKRVVVKSRGSRLQAPVDDVSLGTTWSGVSACRLGLVDEVQDSRVYFAKRFRAIPEMRIHRAAPVITTDTRDPGIGPLARIINRFLSRGLG
jgi:ClpP class serine protease